MLSNKSFEPVSFDPQDTNERSQKTANIQTEHVVYESEEVQTVETKSIETQTVSAPAKTPQYDETSLANFLKRITPSVLQYLDEKNETSSFNDYVLKNENKATHNVQLINRLNSLEMSDFKGKISCTAWSIGGGTLAVAHSALHHESWCYDVTKIEFFTLSKDNLLMSKPNQSLEVSACVTSMAYHPEEPSILAAGLFNGDVMVWNLRDESTINPLQVCTHGDLVSQIQWNLKLLKEGSALVSSSAEGFINVHKLSVNFTQASLVKRFKISKEKNPAEKGRPQSASGKRDRAAEAGLQITTFDFSVSEPLVLIVGTLCGGLYRCSLELAVSIDDDNTIFDPVVKEYERHEGTVTCVKCVPTKSRFVSCASDKVIRIYDFDVVECTNAIDVENTMVNITWHFGNKDIFLAYGAGSEIKFFNVNTGRQLSKIMLYSESRENATTLSFNPKQEMVAIGDSRANLEIWRISRNI